MNTVSFCEYCTSLTYGEYCSNCGFLGEDGSSGAYESSESIESVIEKIYDLNKDVKYDKKEMERLLLIFKNKTGKEKPGFMT